MEIIKVFYTKDKKSRIDIRRRDDGLIDISGAELELEFYVDHDTGEAFPLFYYWHDDGASSFITDSLELAEKEALRWLDNEYIEGPIVEFGDSVVLVDGRTGHVTCITEDGDYIVRIDGTGVEESIDLQDIKEAEWLSG